MSVLKQFISVIMKPTLDCNLRCRHCYHRPSECSDDVMSTEVLEKSIRLVHEEYDSTRFIWHGGEPLLATEAFFKQALKTERRYFGRNLERCGNTIQTNGLLLKPKFIEFCKNNRINLGVSYEGDYSKGLRPGADIERIRNSIEYMVRKGHMFTLSTTVHGGNVNDMIHIYDQFNSMGASFCYNPVVRIGCGSDNKDVQIDAETYIRNSIEAFDNWISDKESNIPVMPFFQYVLTAMSEPNISDCAHSSCLTKWICIYPNGDLYPCGKACPEQFRMGNIGDMEHLSEAFESDGFRNILIGSIERRSKCKDCEIYRYCNGGCSIDAMADGDIESNGGFGCKVYKAVFSHIKSTMDEIVDTKPDLSRYNHFIRDAVVGKLINPRVYDSIVGIQ